MIDAKQLRSDTNGVRAALARRGAGELVEDFLKLDEEHRSLLGGVEQVRAERNAAAKAIAEAKQRGDDTSVPIAKQSALKARQADEEQRLSEVQQRMAEVMMQMPNVPDETAADGMSEEDAKTIRVYGEPPTFPFPPKDHVELAGPEGLGLIEMEAAARVSGSRFHYLLGDLVRLEFALMQWSLDKL
ncbi:MAG: seryl-tRNA synthetase, partial [Gaiellales bacterium]|nr:seryl-tRNA synthetase [Gaiellales bacterium]